jgi:hypothetical protein
MCTGFAPAQPDTPNPTNIVLSVSSLPTATTPVMGPPVVTWSTGDGSPGIVTVKSGGLAEKFFAYSPEGSAPAPWLSIHRTYVFQLYSIAPKRRLLARLHVNRTASLEVVSRPQAPSMTSPVENRFLQLLPFAFSALILVLAVMYIREVRNDV